MLFSISASTVVIFLFFDFQNESNYILFFLYPFTKDKVGIITKELEDVSKVKNILFSIWGKIMNFTLFKLKKRLLKEKFTMYLPMCKSEWKLFLFSN